MTLTPCVMTFVLNKCMGAFRLYAGTAVYPEVLVSHMRSSENLTGAANQQGSPLMRSRIMTPQRLHAEH